MEAYQTELNNGAYPGADSSKATHGHHIVYKKGNGATQQKDATEAKDILLAAGIDPFFGQENLAFAPNQGHRSGVLKEILKLIKNNDGTPRTRAQITTALAASAELYIIRDSTIWY